MSMQRTVLYLPAELIEWLDKKADTMNHGFSEKPWDRFKLARSILRDKKHSEDKAERLQNESRLKNQN